MWRKIVCNYNSKFLLRRDYLNLNLKLCSTTTAPSIIPNVFDINKLNNENQRENTLRDCSKPYEAIPGPKGLPFIGNSWRFAPFIGHYRIHELDKVMWSLYNDFGPIVKVSGLIGHPDLLFVFSADSIEQVFRREEAMPHRPSMPSLKHYKQQLQGDFFRGNSGVIGVHGPEWETFRKQVQHALLPPAIARSYAPALDAIASDFLKRMEDMLDSKRELPHGFLYEIYKWALESVAYVSLDTRLGCLDQNLSENSEPYRIISAINVFFWNVAEVELKMPIWRIYRTKAYTKYIGALEQFRTTCLNRIENSMGKMAQGNDPNSNKDLSIFHRILLKTQNPKLAAVLALDLLLVGVDTTSVALASILYQLAIHPAKQERLYQELEQVLKSPDDVITANLQDKMPFLKACIKETLRLYPVIIGNGRSLQTDAIIAGYNVPRGTHVIFPHLVTGHSQDYFEEPEKFLPERWLTSEQCPFMNKNLVSNQKSVKNRNHPFASLPFGYGRRSCLGRRFAEAELQILLAKIFRRYLVEFKYGPLTYKITPTYVPVEPLKFKLTPRA